MADSDEPTDAGALGEAYERLRDAVLSGGAGGWRLGHGVLCTRGTVAWMTAVGDLAPPANTTGAAGATRADGADGADGVASRFSFAGEDPARAETTSLPRVDQVVAVLTQMVLPLAA